LVWCYVEVSDASAKSPIKSIPRPAEQGREPASPGRVDRRFRLRSGPFRLGHGENRCCRGIRLRVSL
jgi:hypothetical protein